MTALGSIAAMVAAWAEGKSALDIVVYGLAVLAALVVLWTFGRGIVDRSRGVPMTTAIRERLTFGEIADRWATEMSGHPGALPRNEILQELLRGVWLGQFGDGLKLAKRDRDMASILKDKRPNYAVTNGDYGDYNRVKLAQALHLNIGQQDVGLAKWDHIKEQNTPWGEIAALRIETYGEMERRGYIEMLSVPRETFRRWAHAARRQLPTFWFG